MGLMGSLLSSGSVGSFDLREATTTTWRFEVERFGRCASVGSVAGPSTALRFAQDDKFWGGVEESGRAELDTPPFAKSAKGRVPRGGASMRSKAGEDPISKCERSGAPGGHRLGIVISSRPVRSRF